MKVNKKLIQSLGVLIFLTLASCNGVPVADVENCVMPQESILELKNVTSDNLLNAKADPSDNTDNTDSNQPELPPRDCVIPPKAVGADLEINAKLMKFDETQEAKMREALIRLKRIVNSELFKERVLAHTYNGEQRFVDNDGLTNEEIYYKIMEGAETLLPDVDREMDLDIELYYSSRNVVGYTYPNVLQIWVNKKYFNTNSYGAVAANVIHEWTHKLGFGHAYNRTSSRPYSVPYGVGTIMKELVNDM